MNKLARLDIVLIFLALLSSVANAQVSLLPANQFMASPCGADGNISPRAPCVADFSVISKPTGAPSSLNMNTFIVDVQALRGWGYIGDASAHALSTVTSFNNQKSTGWTLVQWQAVLPAATALSDEIDWAALQSMVNTGASVILPAGTARMSHPITAPCSSGLSIRGAGPKLTKLIFFTAGADGIDFCVAQQAVHGNTLSIRDVEIDCSATSGNCGTAIKANIWAPTGFHLIDNVEAGPISGHSWANGINLINGSRVEINRVTLSGTFTPTTGTVSGVGITLASATNAATTQQGAFATNITNTEIYGWATCIAANSTTVNGVEGVIIDKGSCDSSNNFLSQTNTNAATYQASQYVVTNSQIHIWKQVASMKGVLILLFNNNSFLFDAPGPGGGVDLFSIDDVVNASFHHDQMIFGPGSAVNENSVYNFKGTDFVPNNITLDHQIINNGFSTAAPTTAGIIVPPGTLAFNEEGTAWGTWSATGKPEIQNAATDPSVSISSVSSGVPSISCNGSGASSMNTSSNGRGGGFTTNTGATSCTITWNILGEVTRAVAPFCTGSLSTSVTPSTFSATTTTLVVGFASAVTGVYGTYNCANFK